RSGGGGQFTDPVSDIAVGNGLLVVPAGNTLTAFGGPVVPPPPPGPTATHTTLAASANPVPFGQPISLVATIDTTDGGGTVRFSASGAVIPACGSVPVQKVGSAYVALCTASALSVGSHVASAAYSGDG